MISPADNFNGIEPPWSPGRVWQDAAGPLMIDIPPGWFTMGENAGDKFASQVERPAHEVSISPGLALSIAPVTVAEFRRFRPGWQRDEAHDLPAVQVSWVDAFEYCAWLSLETGRPYRLPSESEWEFACRAGSVTAFAFGDEITPSMANYLYAENGARIGRGVRTPAGAYPPNVFGLHDVHGNVCEWVADVWHPSYHGAPAEGSPWNGHGELRVLRGGAWDYLPRLLRSSHRDCLPRHCRRDNVGFRIAVGLSGPNGLDGAA
jgi:formylglycine-generating enzyme required for sulfatase activity